MKVFALILILATTPLARAGEIPSAVKGTWIVKEYRFGGISALSKREAKSWIGKKMTIGSASISLIGDKISDPTIHHSMHDAQTYFMEGFRIKPSQVGYKASTVSEYEIRQSDGNPWTAPGSLLLVLDDTQALTCWDGVFFLLQREPPPSSAPESKIENQKSKM